MRIGFIADLHVDLNRQATRKEYSYELLRIINSKIDLVIIKLYTYKVSISQDKASI